jgi:hypothetical protein
MVPMIKVKGFRCCVDEAVFSNRRGDFAQLVSLVGSREAVKAVWARLMKGEAAYLDMGPQVRAARMNTTEGGKLLTERLPSGAFHGLLLSQAVLRGELVLCEREVDLPARFFHYLTQKLRLPLHSDWQDWLWDHALSTGMIEQMSSQRLHAYEVNLSVYDLEAEVRQALLAGELPEIEVRHAA